MNKHDEFWRHEATKEDYADTNIPLKAQIKYIADAIRPALYGRGGQIMEFGCGYGRLTKEVQKAFPKSIVVGLDINPYIITEAQKRDRKALYKVADKVEGVQGQDVVYCVQVLQHMSNDRKRQFFEEAAAILKRAGVLVIQYVEGDSDSFLTHDAQWAEVSQWLKDAGFEIASVEHNLIQDRWTWATAVKG